jgi:hypothetical protein
MGNSFHFSAVSDKHNQNFHMLHFGLIGSEKGDIATIMLKVQTLAKEVKNVGRDF